MCCRVARFSVVRRSWGAPYGQEPKSCMATRCGGDVGIFATRAKRSAAAPEAMDDLTEELRAALPPYFEAVGEAIASGAAPLAACGEAGRELARAGVAFGDALDSLRTTVWMVRGREPDHPEVRSLSVGWSEATLGYLHRLSCVDPLTGLSTQAHVRGRLTEIFRDPTLSTGGARHHHALVVIEALDDGGTLDHAARMARLGEIGRAVFAGAETIGRVGPRRIVVIATRDDRLARRVAVLRRMLDQAHPEARLWIEGLPDSDSAAGALLEELARL